MNLNSTTAPRFALPQDAPAAARRVLGLLRRLAHGSLTVQLPDGSVQHFGGTPGQGPTASLTLRNWRVCGAALRSGDIGFAESYIDGDWTTPNLAALLAVFVANRRAIDDVFYGHWFGRLLYRLRHQRNRNSKAGSARNIHAHYDLGNDFYRLWLDETMNYSAAWFEGDLARPMPEAQRAKVRRALEQAGVRAGDRVLEIGCGWGALAESAARDFGAAVTGVTLSCEQLAWAQRRTAGLPVDLRLQDYRDIGRSGAEPPFDAICSIEMVEAVGREYWPAYFNAVHRLLKPGGRACIQSIVIDDALWPRYVDSSDFIQQYIFPGGCLPCPREFRRAAAAAGFSVIGELAFGADYAETLRRWHERFAAQRGHILQLGFDERFMRTWEFYLAYCEAAFAQGNCDVVQFTLQKQ
jgi:cyclopropane-fatty-acyl-phospholipid synthase